MVEQIPDGLAAVWAAHRGDVPVRRGLDVDAIITAAIAIADADGLGAVSMGRVASDLGFTPMSLYRHVGSKDELVLHMQDVALGPPPPDLGDVVGDDWRGALEGWAVAVRSRFRAHPWILQTIPLLGPPATPNQLAWLDQALRGMADLPFSTREKLSAVLALDALVLGGMLFEAAATPIADVTPSAADYWAVLDAVVDEAALPALRGIVDGIEDEPDEDEDVDFRFALARLLDGIAALVAAR